MLMAVAASLSLVAGRKVTLAKVLAGCCAIVAITNLRSYLGLSALFILLIGAISAKYPKNILLCLAFLASAAIGGFTWPGVRWAAGGDWFLPQNDLGYFMATAWSSKCGGSNFAEIAYTLPVDARPLFLKAGCANSEFTYEDAHRLVSILTSHGYKTAHISKLFSDSARALNTDNKNITQVRIRKALISLGMPNIALFGSKNTIMHRGMAPQDFLSHIDYVYQYQSWSKGGIDFDRFFKKPDPFTVGGTLGGDWFVRTHESYVCKRSPSLLLRLLAYVPLDLWAVIGVLSMFRIFHSGRISLGLVFLAPCLINLAVMYQVPLGNPRYSYILVPLYFMAAISFLSLQANYAERLKRRPLR
jgi:hypothetical protein